MADHDDIAALLQDAARVMNDDDDDDDDDESDDEDEDTGSFMSPGFVLREIPHDDAAMISPTDLVRSHHERQTSSSSNSSAKMTPTTFLDRMLQQDGGIITDEDMGKLMAPNLDPPDHHRQRLPAAIREEEPSDEDDDDASMLVAASHFDTSGEHDDDDDDIVANASDILDLDDSVVDAEEAASEDDDDDDGMEDAKMEEDLVDIEALMSQSLTTTTTAADHHRSNNNNSSLGSLGNNSNNNNNTSHSAASKNAFELLMSQSVSDILKAQEETAVTTTTATTVVISSPPPSRPGTPFLDHNKPVDPTSATTEQHLKSPVDRAISGLFKAMGGVFLQPNLMHHRNKDDSNNSNNSDQHRSPTVDGYDILAAAQRDKREEEEVEEEKGNHEDDGKIEATQRPTLASSSTAHGGSSAGGGTGDDGNGIMPSTTTADNDNDNFLSSFQLFARGGYHHRTSSSIMSRESSEDAMSFVTATENMADTPKSLQLPHLETVESFPQQADQATTPKRSGSFVPPPSAAGGTNGSGNSSVDSGNAPPPPPEQHHQHHEHKVLKPAITTTLGRGDGLIMTVPADGDDPADLLQAQVSPMAGLALDQVEQVFRTNEVLVQMQGPQDLVSLSSASSTAALSQLSKATEPNNSRWIKQGTLSSAAAGLPTFNPSRSIFANKSYDSPISPPGSPPEPVYSWVDDDDDNDDGDHGGDSDAPVMMFPGAINWEMLGFPVEDGMMTECSSVNASDHGSRTTRLSAKQRMNSPDRVPNSMGEMRQRVKSPDKRGVANAVSPSKGRNPSLEEKLASVLTLDPIGLPFRYQKPTHLDYAASLCWQQLLTCWKYNEMARALTTQQPSRHFVRQHRLDDRAEDDGDLSSGSSRVRKPLIANLRLNGIELHPPIRPETRNLDGFNPGDGLAMTRFLDSLPSRGGFLRHDVEDLLEFADQTTADFAKLMETVVAFARFDSTDVEFEVNVKQAEAITKKARQKYEGDLRQVKDVLRSKIIFPTESSLVCGLVKLFQLEEEHFKVVRIKNLFRRDGNDDLVDSPLPTKYRHILVNIRWKSGFLSEIQLNLARMYDIMQDEGCKLHQRLIDLKNAWNGFPTLLTELTVSILSQAPAGQVQSFLAGASLSPCPAEPGSKNKGGGAIQQLKAPNLDDSSTNTDRDDEPKRHDISEREHLEELRKAVFSDGDLFLAILEKACLDTSRRPRDLPIHYSCYLILRSILHNANDTDHLPFLGFNVNTRAELADHAKRCLMRALSISNQALSVGMYGWLEYGTRSPLVRLLGQPFDLLRLLAYDYALLGHWNHSERILKERLLRCEQHLPRYHPTTLICMIDLGIASQNTGQKRFASRLVSQASLRLSDYLAEMEKGVLLNLSKSTKVVGKASDTVVRIEHGRDALTMLQAFVSIMRQEMKREMVDIVMLAESNEAILINHCFLGEALCILANCRAASRALSGCRKELRGAHDPLWTEAASHFHLALSGFIVQQDLKSMVVARAAFGLTRCLRESNESEKALEILSLVTSRHLQAGQTISTTRNSSSSSSGSVVGGGANSPPHPPGKRFLRCTPKNEKSSVLLPQVIASLCLWLMAALALDGSPDEDGRGLAFRYLHAASVSLQTTLGQASEDDSLRSSYIQFLSMIEDEALQIAEPIYE